MTANGLNTVLERWFSGRGKDRPLRPYTPEPSLLANVVRSLALIGGVSLFCFVYGFGYALTTPYLLVPFLVPLAVLLLLVIWALPDTDRAPTNMVVALTYGLFAALFLWPNYLALSLPGLPWITVVRLIGFPMVFALLICVSVSPTFRRKMAEDCSAAPLIWKPLVIFAVIMVLSVGLSDNKTGSFQRLVIYLVTWIAVFFAAVYTFRKPGRLTAWCYVIWVAAVILVAIGLWEQRLGHIVWANSIPSFLQVEDESVQRVLAGGRRAATGVYRVQGTSTTALGLAEYLALTAPFVIYLVLNARWLVVRVAAALTLPGLVVVILATDSRLGLVGMLFGSVLYLLIWALQRWKRLKGDLIGPAVTLGYPVLATVLLAATFVIGRIRSEVWGGGAHAASNQGRIEQLMDGLPKILNNPLGHGVAQGAETLGRRNPVGVLTIDNYYLAVALEYGVVGFIVHYGMFFVAAFAAFRAALHAAFSRDREQAFAAPLAAALFMFLLIKTVFSQVDNHPFAFMMLGAVVALLARAKTEERERAVAAGLAPAPVEPPARRKILQLVRR